MPLIGYTKDKDGKLVILPEEAEIVRKMFELYLQGYGVRRIKRYLEKNNIKTVTGKSEWRMKENKMVARERKFAI
ncbi:MAG: recombinase family protein [Clostridiales bacterium]|nr:recombinase family protein [Clostridiales bacterium]